MFDDVLYSYADGTAPVLDALVLLVLVMCVPRAEGDGGERGSKVEGPS